MKVDRGLIEPLFAGRDARDLAIAHAVGRSEADGKHGRSAGRPVASCRRGVGWPLPRVAAVGEQDDAGDLLSPIAIANGRERALEVALASVRAQLPERGGLEAVADAIHLGRERLATARAAMSRSAATAPEPTAPGRRHRSAACCAICRRGPARWRRARSAAARARSDGTGTATRTASTSARHAASVRALARRERRQRPAVLGVGQAADGGRQQHRQPPRQRVGEMHQSSVVSRRDHSRSSLISADCRLALTVLRRPTT